MCDLENLSLSLSQTLEIALLAAYYLLKIFLICIDTALIEVFNFAFQEQYDTHDPKGHCLVALPFLMKRTKVIEIVAARDIVFALAHSGVCAAFSRGT